jgi:hypothetical protein
MVDGWLTPSNGREPYVKQVRIIAATASVFTIAALALASPGVMTALAVDDPVETLMSAPEELFPQRLDPSRLLKWDFAVEPGVSGDPIRQSTVRKIGYGRTSFVTVVETASGVYSSDGLGSPHIRYPGIHKTLRREPATTLAIWDGVRGWTLAHPLSGGSFATIVPFEGGQLLTTDEKSCVVTETGIRC